MARKIIKVRPVFFYAFSQPKPSQRACVFFASLMRFHTTKYDYTKTVSTQSNKKIAYYTPKHTFARTHTQMPCHHTAAPCIFVT